MRRFTMTALILAAFASSTQADFVPLETVTPGYLASTTLIDISGMSIGTAVSTVSDGIQAVSFSDPLTRADVPVEWATWGYSPNVESSTPSVLYLSPGNGLAITLAIPAHTFGFELLGAAWVVSEFQATFLDAHGNFMGTVNGYLDGYHGARLFAASTTTNPFSTVLISVLSDDSDGLAIAQLRYAVPEPTSYLMVIQAIAMVGVVAWRKRRKA